MTSERDKLATAVIDREAFERRTALIVLAAALFVMVVSFTALAFGLHKVADLAENNQRVTCAIRKSWQEQLDSNRKFTKANPNGGVLLGVKFSRADLDRQRVSLEKRLNDTRGASC